MNPPLRAPALVDLARAREREGLSGEAVALWAEAVRCEPADTVELEAVCDALVRLGRAVEAVETCRRLAGRFDGSTYPWRQAAVIQFNCLGDGAGATESLEKALERHPDDTETHVLLASLCIQTMDFERARRHGQVALATEDDRVSLTIRQRILEDFEGAIEVARRILAEHPADVETLVLCGLSLYRLSRHEEACGYFYRAAEHAPYRGDVLFPLANALLLLGAARAGWLRYDRLGDEAFLRATHADASGHLAKFWRGEPLAGKRIVVVHYVGLGDYLMYARYARDLKAAGAHVTFCCQAELLRLIEGLEGVDRLTSDRRAETWGDYDHWVWDLLLPARLGAGEGRVPAYPDGYVKRPAIRPGGPLTRPAAADRLRVGLCWTTSPSHFSGMARCLLPEDLRPLAALEGVDWYALQRRPAEPDFAARSGLEVLDISDEWADFHDSAAFAAELDLTISICSAPVHLVGALGLPVWALISEPADWRWGARGDRTPWYPQARIFRQPRRGDWRSVMETVARTLRAERDSLMGRAGGMSRF